MVSLIDFPFHVGPKSGAYQLAAGAGRFALTGESAALIYSGAGAYRLAGAAGTFALTGEAAGLARGGRLSAGAGAFALTGESGAVARGAKTAAAAGAFALTGGAATVARGAKTAAAAGAFTLTGEAAALKQVAKLQAAAGSFALTGEAAALARGAKLLVAFGAFTSTGEAAAAARGGKLLAAAGAFALTGETATLTYGSGAWTPASLSNLRAWYDPSDFTRMWQDSAKTTPVTAAGQPVGYIADKHGSGMDYAQSTSGLRPTLRQDAGNFYYIEFNGSTRLDGNTAALAIEQNVPFTAAGAAVQTSASGLIWQTSRGTGTNDRSSFAYSVNGTGYEFSGRTLDTDGYTVVSTGTTDTAKRAFIGVHDYINAAAALYVDGTLVTGPSSYHTANNTSNTASQLTSVGGWGGGGYNITANLYSLVIAGALSTSERGKLTTYLGSTYGAVL